MLKAVILDLDGVILDIEPVRIIAMKETMKHYDLNLSDDFCLSFSDSRESQMLEAIKRIYRLPASLNELLQDYTEIRNHLLVNSGFPIIPDVLPFIKDLDTHNIKIGVVSSSSAEFIHNALKYLNIHPYLSATASVDTVTNPLPASDLLCSCASKMGVLPAECLVISDSCIGLTAANAASMSRIGFFNPHSGKQNMSDVEYIIEGFQEVDAKFIIQTFQHLNGEPVTVCETERLIIRELSVDDIKKMYVIYQSDEVRQFIDDIDHYLELEIEKHKAYIKNVYAFYGYGYWGVFQKDNGELIGRCGIQNNIIDSVSEIELGYLLDTKHWGCGYAYECTSAVLRYAFHELTIPRVVALIDKTNTRSIKLAKKLGMHLEKELLKNGRSCELYVITS